MPTTRTRIAHLAITPVLILDDGENLTPGPQTHAQAVPVHAVGEFVAALLAQVEQMNQEAEQAGSATG